MGRHAGKDKSNRPLTFIDLFCGCGGFTLGLQRAGLRCLAAIDFNRQAVETFKANIPEVPNVLEEDLTQSKPEHLSALFDGATVDVIVGGPPCQGFSTVRQVDGANHGARFKEDKRRELYRDFLRYVDFFQPRIFVLENVLGIRSAAGGEYFTRVQREARELGRSSGGPGYRVHGQIEDAWRLGVPQKRRRQLIIGVRNDVPGYFLPDLSPSPRAIPGITLGRVLGDLPKLRAGEGIDERPYDEDLRRQHLAEYGDEAQTYLEKVLEISKADKLFNHVARPHNDRDLRDFKKLREGENSATATRERGVEFEFPYDKSSFKDRYTRQSRIKPCSTIVAHLSKDGLMFVHPTQNRSLTPREAARIQSFPDWFRFPKARTHSFRLIGNAVPPLVSEAIGLSVVKFVRDSADRRIVRFPKQLIPRDERDAIAWLSPLLDLGSKTLRAVPDETFKRAWYAIGFLYAGLHPDSALDHGLKKARHKEDDIPDTAYTEPRLFGPYFQRSGWPVILAPIANEARCRYDDGDLKDDEFYCLEAQLDGMRHRNPGSSLDQGRQYG